MRTSTAATAGITSIEASSLSHLLPWRLEIERCSIEFDDITPNLRGRPASMMPAHPPGEASPRVRRLEAMGLLRVDDFLAGFPTVKREQVVVFLEEAAARMISKAS